MLAFLVGAALGLVFAVFGAGGGIVAVPVLLAVFKLPMASATAGSLGVVWAAATTAAASHARAGRVEWRVAIAFAPPSMLGAVLGARLNALVPERVTVILFALVLTVATLSLFRPKPDQPHASPTWAVLLAGLGIGTLTGFLGVGGGFLVVPALVTLARVPLHRAVATSAAVISASSLAGAVSALSRDTSLLQLLLPIAGGAVTGALLGAPLSGKLPERPLRLGFALLAFGIASVMAYRAVTL